MALSSKPSLKNTGIEVLFSMIVLEFKTKGNFNRVENEIFEQMPWIVEKMNQGNHDFEVTVPFESLFLKASLTVANSGEFMEQGKSFLRFLNTFLSLASDINDLPVGLQNEDVKTEAMLKMINFLSDLNKAAMLIIF
jgi:hypothetical protein